MATLTDEIAAYEDMRNGLEAQHFGEWVVFHNQELVGTYKEFEEAASDAIERFGRGPYLIRQVGAAPMRLPASVQYRSIDADG